MIIYDINYFVLTLYDVTINTATFMVLTRTSQMIMPILWH